MQQLAVSTCNQQSMNVFCAHEIFFTVSDTKVKINVTKKCKNMKTIATSRGEKYGQKI